LSIEDTKNVAIAILDAPIFFEGREMVASCYLIGVWMAISQWLILDLLLPLLVHMVGEGEGVLRISTKKHSLECIDLALTTMHVLLFVSSFHLMKYNFQIMFPSTLLGTGEKWTMMKTISVTEYLNYEAGT